MYRLLFPSLRLQTWVEVSLDAAASERYDPDSNNPLVDPVACGVFVQELSGGNCSYGGYMEDRSHLWRGLYMVPRKPIHLGVDYNVPEGTPVHTPIDGVVYSTFSETDQDAGWGGRVTILIGGDHYLLFGHLDPNDLPPPNTRIIAGDPIGIVGHPAVNGNWYPHLHLQMTCETPAACIDGYAAPSDWLTEVFPDPRSCLSPEAIAASTKPAPPAPPSALGVGRGAALRTSASAWQPDPRSGL